jgi:dihydroorotase
LVATRKLSLVELVRRMSLAPARRVRLAGGTLDAGQPAHLVVLDLESRWTVRAQALQSRSRNSPFIGRSLRGRVVATIHRGRIVHRAGSETAAAAPVG